MKAVMAAVLVAVSLTVAAPAHADDVQGFIDALHSRGISAGHGDGTMVVAGQMVCEYIGEGNTPLEAAKEVYVQTDSSIGAEDAGFIVGASIRYLCPEYLGRIA